MREVGREVASFLGLANPEDYCNSSFGKAQNNHYERTSNPPLPNPSHLFQPDVSEESMEYVDSPKSACIQPRKSEMSARKRPYSEMQFQSEYIDTPKSAGIHARNAEMSARKRPYVDSESEECEDCVNLKGEVVALTGIMGRQQEEISKLTKRQSEQSSEIKRQRIEIGQLTIKSNKLKSLNSKLMAQIASLRGQLQSTANALHNGHGQGGYEEEYEEEAFEEEDPEEVEETETEGLVYVKQEVEDHEDPNDPLEYGE